METNKIYHGNALDVLKTFPEEIIDCVMTSPPYWALRDYRCDGQLGLEPTIKEYILKLCDLFDEIKRVLKKEGTCWVNLGDTYYSVSGGQFLNDNLSNGQKNIESGVSVGNQLKKGKELTEKNLCLIPERFMIEMQNRGWIIRNKIIWYKRNSMPTSVKDRFGNKWEHILLFVKNKRYYFNLDSVRKPLEGNYDPFNLRVRDVSKGKIASHQYKATEEEIIKYKTKYKGVNAVSLNDRKAYERKILGVPHDLANCNPLGGNPGDHWDITTKSHPFAHFAVYPEQLCEIPLKAGCPIGGIVLDPFFGSGTTGVVALKQNKQFIGIELNQEYIKIAESRLKPYLTQTKLSEVLP